eukprot:CAMPEP_0171386978 /NCGR_PEP_ID=MMETSP0879-20121228/39766_1 /TAXON_ID=67004 /ORGANISM="Thalassiosira weissflogii, Strain CCMP1336" /LENGTH=402 /DNA_ID=CAMNT_0011899299 /DNA_START=114 /DNA_END=1319 /DNA_ORIENTATION=-
MELQANYDFRVDNTSICRRLKVDDPSLTRLTVSILVDCPGLIAPAFPGGSSGPSNLHSVSRRIRSVVSAICGEKKRIEVDTKILRDLTQLGTDIEKNTHLKKLILRVDSPSSGDHDITLSDAEQIIAAIEKFKVICMRLSHNTLIEHLSLCHFNLFDSIDSLGPRSGDVYNSLKGFIEQSVDSSSSGDHDIDLLDAEQIITAIEKFNVICMRLSHNTSIEHLSLCHFNLFDSIDSLGPRSGDVYDSLSGFIEQSTSLKSIQISRFNRTRNGRNPTVNRAHSIHPLRPLLLSLSNRRTPLEKLTLFNNRLNDMSIRELADVFSRKPELTPLEIELNDNSIGSEGCLSFAKLLSDSKCSAKKVDLSGNAGINDNCAKELSDRLKNNNQIEKLWLCGTSITTEGW